MPALFFKNIRLTLRDDQIEHTLFALPFAFLGAVLAAQGIPAPMKLVWISLAMVSARSTAMAFNRLVDRRYGVTGTNLALPADFSRFRVAVYPDLRCALLICRCDVESADVDSRPGSARECDALFLYQALDVAFPCRFRVVPVDRTHRSLDSGPWSNR